MNETTTKQVYRIGVAGMDCSACEKLLLKSIKHVQGINASYADADEGTLTIYADPDVSVEALVGAIVRAGFVPQGIRGEQPLVPVIDLVPTAGILGVADSAPAEITAIESSLAEEIDASFSAACPTAPGRPSAFSRRSPPRASRST